MAYNSLSIDAQRPLNRWSYDRLQPGIVGSVGDVVIQSRLKQSAPDLPMRFNSEIELLPSGSNVQDGQIASYNSKGAMARVNDSNWGSGRSFKTRRGYIIQNLTDPDKLVEPFVSSLGDYTWRDKIATVYEARRTGVNFLPLPGPYQLSPGEIARGGNSVRITDVAGGGDTPETASNEEAVIPQGVYGTSTRNNITPGRGGNFGERASGR